MGTALITNQQRVALQEISGISGTLLDLQQRPVMADVGIREVTQCSGRILHTLDCRRRRPVNTPSGLELLPSPKHMINLLGTCAISTIK
jgi:hypothetical protein